MAGTGATKTETSTPASANRPLFASGGRLVQLIVAGSAVLVLGWAAYYGIGVLRSSAFNNDRAFRVLNEMVVQLDNFQGTMVNLIRLLPEFEECKPALDCKQQWDRYTGKLNVPDISLSAAPSDSRPDAGGRGAVGCNAHAQMPGGGSPDGRYELWIRASEPGRPFTIRSCAAHDSGVQPLELHGSLRSGLPRFVAQTFFDEALVTGQDGTVLATIRSGDGNLTQVELHPGGGDAQMIVDAGELLRRAADADANSDNPARPDAKATAAPGPRDPVRYAAAFDKTIAGKKYRVFVLPFQPSASWYVQRYDSSGNAKTAQPEGTLYVVGLKQARVSQQITYQLWPDGAFAIAVVSLLLLLLWPLLRLKFSNPLEPISRTTAFAAMVCFLLIPGVICITAVWAWSRVTLINWADDSARRYADDVESYLVAELQTTTSLLQRYRDQVYSQYTGLKCESVKDFGYGPVLDEVPLDASDLGTGSAAVARSMREKECQIQYLRKKATDGTRPAGWSPLRTVLGLNRDGYSYGPRLTAFGITPQRLKLELRDREYFQALSAGETWLPEAPRPARADSSRSTPPRSSWAVAPDAGFVAQRLFNRGDGALVLQVAVADKHGPFHRAVTGDTRAYGLTASVAPLLLRFAVVDNATGVVLFHSNEDRSLVENFFVETEHSSELQGKIGRRSSFRSSVQPWLEDLFTTNYLSEAHRFYVRPVSHMPWSVIVFYSTKALGDVPYQAGLASLVTFVLLIGIILVVVVVAVRLSGGTAGSCRRRMWPRWERRAPYVVFAWAGAGIIFCMVAALVWSARRDWALPAPIFALGLLALGIALYQFWRSRQTKDAPLQIGSKTPRARFAPGELAYVACLFESAVLLSALPATWLALQFGDLSLQSFVYNGLGAGAEQVERRHALIAEDLRRWDPDEEKRAQRYPSAWALADELSVPGYRVTQGTGQESGKPVSRWEVTSFKDIPWWNLRGPPADDALLRLIWSATHNSTVSRSWLPPERSAGGEGSQEDGGKRPASSKTDAWWLQTHAQTKWQREYDGHRVSLVAWYSERDREQYEESKTSSSASSPKEPPAAGDPDSIPLGLRKVVLLLLLAGSLLGIYVLTLSVSRRLFGSRSVFLFGPRTARTAPSDTSTDDPAETWGKLKQADQLYLHQLAHDQMVNPTNEEGIERLTAARLLKFDPWPKIADPKLHEYAETQAWEEEEFRKAQQDASHSLWNSIRTPLLVVVLIVVGVLLYVSSTTMQIVTTVFAGLASLLTYVSQTQNFLRQSGKS